VNQVHACSLLARLAETTLIEMQAKQNIMQESHCNIRGCPNSSMQFACKTTKDRALNWDISGSMKYNTNCRSLCNIRRGPVQALIFANLADHECTLVVVAVLSLALEHS